MRPGRRRSIIKALVKRVAGDERVRFLFTGGFNTVFGFLMFVAVDLTLGRALDSRGLSVLASILTVLVSHLLASLVAFYLYRRLVFRVEGSVFLDFLRFQTVYLLPLVVNLVLLPLLVQWGLPRIPAQAAITVVMTIVSYLGHKFFSFRRTPGPEPAGEPAPSTEDDATGPR